MPNEAEGSLDKRTNGLESAAQVSLKKSGPYDLTKSEAVLTPVVAHPNFEKPFILYTDASCGGLKAVLHQKGDDGRERIIACTSRTYNKHEKKYPITEQECLAVVWGIKKFKQYLSVKPFKIITDHMALEIIRTVDLPSGRKA